MIAAKIERCEQLSKCNRIPLLRPAGFVIMRAYRCNFLCFFLVCGADLRVVFNLMNWHHYLLISNQDSLARSVLLQVLRHGDRLSVAANPFDAQAMIREGHLDAVLVALEENDDDAAVMCRTLRRYSDLPIVMLVSSATRNQVTRGYRLGADAHIEIPCDPRVFRARVSAVMRRFTNPAAQALTPGPSHGGRGE